MTVWHMLSLIGSFNISMPSAVVIALWLVRMPDKSPFWQWIWLLTAGFFIVVASKLAFIGWGIGIHRIDFTGFSGHAMRAAAIFPVMFWLIADRLHHQYRNVGAMAGAVLALFISISRVVVHDHSSSEAISGALIGFFISASFLYRNQHRAQSHLPTLVAAASVMFLLLTPTLPPTPTQSILERTALLLSGHSSPYIRATWQMTKHQPVIAQVDLNTQF